ncbi:hypothetical protein M427DRAFT_154132 [Gonapodya prolifera JEL478]|uniref:Uncharacterized protein n=1 Tax=Gonapodya prolifera (strain JEL478) TaxID=1344416 RepID=A0A139AKE3_GONPJ|nr:hypothetical protein M427DRAFT_154132 [Gonapodya prolifera JEL478]|eukprot:KXS17014.1 hypothetical protein M427DRAFT_154132 [Gonapodya prolifera JEL478]
MDPDLAERLKRLRGDPKPSPSQSELFAKLNELRESSTPNSLQPFCCPILSDELGTSHFTHIGDELLKNEILRGVLTANGNRTGNTLSALPFAHAPSSSVDPLEYVGLNISDSGVDDLLSSVMDEVNPDCRHASQAAIEERDLIQWKSFERSLLRSKLPLIQTPNTSTNSAKRDLKPNLANLPPPLSISLSDFFPNLGTEESKDVRNDLELWCRNCNEDAAIRCVKCKDNPFCQRCFKETHSDDLDFQKHCVRSVKRLKH